MNIETAEYLCSPQGLKLLEDAAHSEKSDFALATLLRTQTTPEFASAISTMLDLRRKGKKKFSRAEQMLFTRPALEQASAEEISRYRTERFIISGITSIADLCCGIGGDSISFTQTLNVTGIDLDPSRLKLAEHNIRVYSGENNFTGINADITGIDYNKLGVEAFFIDPARRTENGKRLFDPQNWSPKFSTIIEIIETALPTACVKCAPGIDYADIPDNAEVEFISYNGELRECILWFGKLRNGIRRTATLLPSGDQLSGDNPHVECTEIMDYIYEPDSAVIRSGLVELLASRINASKISESICFLTSDTPAATPFARCYKVDTIFSYKEKELNRRLKEADCKTVNIIKRGVNADIPKIQKKLKLRGSRHLTLLLTRNFEDRVGILVTPVL